MMRIEVTHNGHVSNFWDMSGTVDVDYNVGSATILIRAWDDHESASEYRGSPEYALKTIERHIRDSPDSFTEAGLWITRITNRITQAVSETDKEAEATK
jgi:hypothetical protein